MFALELKPGELTLDQLRRVYREPVQISLSEHSKAAIKGGCKVVQDVIDSGQTVYGINTGFGLLANTRSACSGVIEKSLLAFTISASFSGVCFALSSFWNSLIIP